MSGRGNTKYSLYSLVKSACVFRNIIKCPNINCDSLQFSLKKYQEALKRIEEELETGFLEREV